MYHEDAERAEPQGRVVGRPEVLRRFPSISSEIWEKASDLFPVRVTRSWFQRLHHAGDPLARQVLPHPDELLPHPEDNPDPVGEVGRSPLPWVVRKHPDRVLLLVTRRCHLYCRYCFRRNHTGAEDPSPSELSAALDYIRASGAREVILSGGDPLAVSDARLQSILDAVRPAIPVVRIHTRAPITAPERVTPALVAVLRERAPVWILVHCNHPQELSPEVRGALARLVDAGIPVLNQAVLLRGINDDVSVLAELCETLVSLRVFPYYLHHTDPAAGNRAFRVELEQGLALYSALSLRVSGVALPRYVIDPPDGGGKMPVDQWVREKRLGR